MNVAYAQAALDPLVALENLKNDAEYNMAYSIALRAELGFEMDDLSVTEQKTIDRLTSLTYRIYEKYSDDAEVFERLARWSAFLAFKSGDESRIGRFIMPSKGNEARTILRATKALRKWVASLRKEFLKEPLLGRSDGCLIISMPNTFDNNIWDALGHADGPAFFEEVNTLRHPGLADSPPDLSSSQLPADAKGNISNDEHDRTNSNGDSGDDDVARNSDGGSFSPPYQTMPRGPQFSLDSSCPCR